MDNNDFKINDEENKGDMTDDIQNGENREESEQENLALNEAQAEADGEKEKDNAAEKESYADEADNSEEKGTGDDRISAEPRTYSTVYSAPYYSSSAVSADKPRTKKGYSGKRVAALVAVCVIIALIVGATIGVAAGYLVRMQDNYESEFDGNGGEPSGEVINIIKNNAGVKVDEQTYSEESGALSVMGVVEKAADSVVEVSTLTSSNYGQYVSSGAGSGVIISVSNTHAYIVTNYHVVGDSDSITVRLTDKREYTAEYIDGDESLDLAMIKIAETENITQAVIGSSDSLKVGQGVVAIGNPLGELGGTVTDGIISALDREISIDGTTMVLLQTNAAVNPGNSGGPLCNGQGEVIGIVTRKVTDSDGLGMAIPINGAMELVNAYIDRGSTDHVVSKNARVRASLGIQAASVKEGDQITASYYAEQDGVLVVATTKGGSAEGILQPGDIILKMDGERIQDMDALKEKLYEYRGGDRVTIVIDRLGEEMTVSVQFNSAS